ncbi:MAG: hypothetical protein J6V72_05065, partial [Kiritimatiellae bacterium]|nr:hypothetical protein [Kiritimatiellia bacterium]
GIAGEPEEYGGDCDRVDRVFNAWVPSVPKVAEERGKLKEEWDRNKPGYQDKFAVGQMLRGIQNPLMKMTETHGQAALSRLAELYAKLAKIDPVEPKSIALKGEIERKLDDRAKMEWGKFAIPDFGRKAPTNASHDATRAFVALLDGWKPATADGAAAKAELMAQVTNSIPTWRLGYETGTFNARIDAAKKSGTLEDLAALHPSRVVTNDYLRFDFVSNQWEVLVKRDFEAAVTNFVKKFTADISPRNRGRRPEFTDGDREEIDKTAKSVGAPFDAEAIKNMIGELMASKASAWDEGKRSACKKWVEENIARRPDRDRTGRDGIFDAYVNERRSYRDSEDIFNEIVRTAVYRKVEEWFESDLEFFREGKEGAEGRFESKFRPLCDRVYEDKKNHDPKSWAYPFVARCRDVGHVNKDGYGYATVFPQEFEISQVSGFVVYEGEAPWTKFLGMQIGVSVWTSGVEQVISPCNDDNEGLRVTDRTGEPKPLWSGNVKVRGSQFAPIEFTMKALAVRRGFDEELQRVRDDSFILFDGDPARNGFYGFSKTYTSEGREIKVGVNLAVRRLSGKSVGELLAEAKKEVAAGQK